MNKDINAIDIVRQMVADGQISQDVAEKYCPEIKKYKDEIVKKQILELIRQHSINSDRCMMENWVCAHALLQPFKPSDKQLHYLSWIANVKLGDSVVEQEVSKHLNELLEDLKKLREE